MRVIKYLKYYSMQLKLTTGSSCLLKTLKCWQRKKIKFPGNQRVTEESLLEPYLQVETETMKFSLVALYSKAQ